MFGRKKKNSQITLDQHVDRVMDFYSHYDEMVQDDPRPMAVLTPQVPIGSTATNGWLGGRPSLPPHLEWPTKGDDKLYFACQIDCKALPEGIWSGAGPRAGWLSVFLHGHSHELVVLHFDGHTEPKDGPAQQFADWGRLGNRETIRIPHLPQWNFTIDALPAKSLHTDRTEITSTEDAEDIDIITPRLEDPAYLPFDNNGRATLFKHMREHFVMAASDICRQAERKCLRDEDREWFEKQRPIILESLRKYVSIEGRLWHTDLVDERDALLAGMRQIGDLPMVECVYVKDDDDEGRPVFFKRITKFNDALEYPKRRGVLWWDAHRAMLEWQAINAYTKDPSNLPTSLRSRMEEQWSREIRQPIALMGHCPIGEVFVPHGFDTDTEVLLELKTTNLVGWIWGDCYSIVLLIKRRDLALGDFSKVEFVITN